MTQQLSRRTLIGAGAGAVATFLSGCQFTGSSQDTDKDGKTVTKIVGVQLPGSIDSLDPHMKNKGVRIVSGALLEPLVMQDPKATGVVPAAAESWDVSADGLTYTFHLRKGATWSNGDPVTAKDAEWTFQRLIAPTGALGGGAEGTSAYRPGMGIKGADDFHTGAVKDWATVGIKARDDETLVIELEHANPDFLLAMTDNSMVLLHPKTLQAQPQKWQTPEHWVGNGAYNLERYDQNTAIVVRKNPKYWDAGNVKVDVIERRLGGDNSSNLVAFRSGQLDITTISNDIARTLDKQDPELTKKLQRIRGWVSFYLQTMWGGHPAIQDVRVRRALSLGLERKAFEDIVGNQGGTSLVPDVVQGWSDTLAVKYDVDGAWALLRQAGLDKMPKIRIQFPADEAWLGVVADQWKQAFKSEVVLDIVESGVHADTRWGQYADKNTISFYGGTLGGLPTLHTWVYDNAGPDWVRQFSLSWQSWQKVQKVQKDKALTPAAKAAGVEQILSTECSPQAREFTRVVHEAARTKDEKQRTERYLQAAKLREDIAQTIPIQWGYLTWLVSEKVDGLQLRPSVEGYYCKHLSVKG